MGTRILVDNINDYRVKTYSIGALESNLAEFIRTNKFCVVITFRQAPALLLSLRAGVCCALTVVNTSSLLIVL